MLSLIVLFPIYTQDERYQHLNAEEMRNVEKYLNESMAWINSKMNAQSQLTIAQDPIVKVADIISKIQVCDKCE